MDALPKIQQLSEKVTEVVWTKDWHPNDHNSFSAVLAELNISDINGENIEPNGIFTVKYRGTPPTIEYCWPRHCIAESEGAQIHPSLKVKQRHHVILKGTDKLRDSYSGFCENALNGQPAKFTDLYRLLDFLRPDVVIVCGFAGDICVKFTIFDSIIRKDGKEPTWETWFASDASKSIHPSDDPKLYAELEGAGCTILTTEEVLQRLGELPQVFFDVWKGDLEQELPDVLPAEKVAELRKVLPKASSLNVLLEHFEVHDLMFFRQLFILRKPFFYDFARLIGEWKSVEIEPFLGALVDKRGDFAAVGVVMQRSTMQVKAMLLFLFLYRRIELQKVLGDSVLMVDTFDELRQLLLSVHQAQATYTKDVDDLRQRTDTLLNFSEKMSNFEANQIKEGISNKLAYAEKITATCVPPKEHYIATTVASSPCFALKMQQLYKNTPLKLAAAPTLSATSSTPTLALPSPSGGVPLATMNDDVRTPRKRLIGDLSSISPMVPSVPAFTTGTTNTTNMTKRQRLLHLSPEDSVLDVDGCGPETLKRLKTLFKCDFVSVKMVASTTLEELTKHKIKNAEQFFNSCVEICNRTQNNNNLLH